MRIEVTVQTVRIFEVHSLSKIAEKVQYAIQDGKMEELGEILVENYHSIAEVDLGDETIIGAKICD